MSKQWELYICDVLWELHHKVQLIYLYLMKHVNAVDDFEITLSSLVRLRLWYFYSDWPHRVRFNVMFMTVDHSTWCSQVCIYNKALHGTHRLLSHVPYCRTIWITCTYDVIGVANIKGCSVVAERGHYTLQTRISSSDRLSFHSQTSCMVDPVIEKLD